MCNYSSIHFHIVNKLPFSPFSFLIITILFINYAFSMLFAIKPLTFIFSPIIIQKNPKSIFLIIFIISRIFFAIRPFILTLPMHIIIKPLSFINTTIIPFVNAKAIHLIITPIPIIRTPICPNIFAFSILLSVYIITNIITSIWPKFLP